MTDLINQLSIIWWNWMWPMTLQVTPLALVTLIVNRLFRRKLWPQFRYTLLLLVFLKLCLPPDLSSPTSLSAPVLAPLTKIEMPSPETTTPPAGEPAETREEARSPAPSSSPTSLTPISASKTSIGEGFTPRASLHWKSLAALFWLFTGSILVGLLEVRYRRRLWALRRESSSPDSNVGVLLRSAARTVGLRRIPRIRIYAGLESPAVVGLVKPILLLPERIVRESQVEELRHILIHELAHLKRGDLWVHRITLYLQIVYWFNPLIWIVGRQSREVREVCCDSTVVRLLKGDSRGYRQTLLSAAALWQKRSSAIDLALLERSRMIFERIFWLRRDDGMSFRWLRLLGTVALALLVLFVILPMNAGSDPQPLDAYMVVQKGTFTITGTDTPRLWLLQLWAKRSGDAEIGNFRLEVIPGRDPRLLGGDTRKSGVIPPTFFRYLPRFRQAAFDCSNVLEARKGSVPEGELSGYKTQILEMKQGAHWTQRQVTYRLPCIPLKQLYLGESGLFQIEPIEILPGEPPAEFFGKESR